MWLDWQSEARCAGAGYELFFTPGREQEAKAYCAPCPVREECLAFALVNHKASDDFGVWGGTTAKERKDLR